MGVGPTAAPPPLRLPTKTRILARRYQDGEWIAEAYQSEDKFCQVRGSSEKTALEALKSKVQTIVAAQARKWLDFCKQPRAAIVNCPEGAIKLPTDLWVCKLTKDICPIQAQVFLNDRAIFLQHCAANTERKEQIFESVLNGAYDGFHHVVGRYLCPNCEREGKKPSFQHHYPWELTYLEAYYPFQYERDWPSVRKKLNHKSFGLTSVSNALCARHCQQLAEEIDPGLAATLTILEFEMGR